MQGIADTVHAFTDADDCVNFLTKMKNEKVFMIISVNLDRLVVSLIEQLAQVNSIYVVRSDKTIDETWISKLKKVKGVFDHIQDICDLLKRDIQLCDEDSVAISTISENESANSPTSEHDQSRSHRHSSVSMEGNFDNRIMRAISSQVPFARLLENIVVICLDLNDDLYEGTQRNWFIEVQRIVNIINTFTNVDECVDFLTEIENENVLMIVSGDYSLHVLSLVKEFHQLKSIYVLSKDKSLHEVWTNKVEKVKGVFTEIEDIFPLLKRDIRQCDRSLVPFSVIRANGSTSIAINELDQSFMYTKLVKEILLEIKFDNESKKYFVDFCRLQYINCDPMLQAIDRFDQEYDIHSPIWWYSKETFIYSILNRAFRTQEINTIIKMGFFMQDLHRQIEHVYKNWSDKPSFLTVYRGQGMVNSEFERLREGEGGLLSFNSFLSTSSDRDISFCFADSVQSDPSLVGVLFEIKINSELHTTPFVSLDKISHYQEENEILFSMHSIFEIGEVQQIDERLWKVELLSTTNNDQNMSELTDFIQKTAINGDPWLRLGELLMQMGEVMEAEPIFQALADLYPTLRSNQQEYLNVLYGLGIIKYQQFDFTHALLFYQKALQLSLPSCTGFALIYKGIALVHGAMGNYSAALSTHKKSFEMMQKNTPYDSVHLAVSCGHIGDTYIRLGKPWDAISYLKKSIEILEISLPSNHPSLAIHYNWMGEAYRLGGDYPHAFFYYVKAHKIQEKYLPPNHPELAHTLNDMGLVYGAMGDYSSALSCLQKTLRIRQNSLAPDHPEVAKTYNNIGYVLNAMKHYLKALSFYQKALDIYEKLTDLTLPDLAITYNNVAAVFGNMGDNRTALGFYQKTLKIEQKCFLLDHPTLGTTYNNIAGEHLAIGNYPTALLFLNKTREIQEKGLHLNHPDLAATYNNLASVHVNMGDYSTALSFLEKSCQIQEKSLHLNHPDLAKIYNNLAAVHVHMGDYSAAFLFLDKTRQIQEKSLHPNHPDLAVAYSNLAVAHHNMKDYSTALSFLEKSRDILEKCPNPNHSHLAGVYNNLARVYQAVKEYSTALSFFQKVRIIQEEHLQSNHPDLAVTFDNMGLLYDEMGDYSTALSFLHRARKIQEINFSPDHPARVQTCETIASLHRKIGNW